jgi:hypothetical protein
MVHACGPVIVNLSEIRISVVYVKLAPRFIR